MEILELFFENVKHMAFTDWEVFAERLLCFMGYCGVAADFSRNAAVGL